MEVNYVFKRSEPNEKDFYKETNELKIRLIAKKDGNRINIYITAGEPDLLCITLRKSEKIIELLEKSKNYV